MPPNPRKSHIFTANDDLILTEYMNNNPKGNWIEISKILGQKTMRQCRDRWLNVLSPVIKSDCWTFDEEVKLLEAVKMYGINDWSKIAASIPKKEQCSAYNKWHEIHHRNIQRHKKTHIYSLCQDEPDDASDELWQESGKERVKRVRKGGAQKRTSRKKKNIPPRKQSTIQPVKSLNSVPEQQPFATSPIPPNQPITPIQPPLPIKENFQSEHESQSIFDGFIKNEETDQFLDNYVLSTIGLCDSPLD